MLPPCVPVVIVIQWSAIHNVSSLGQAQEQLAVEALIPQLAVEALHVPVLPRALIQLGPVFGGQVSKTKDED